jgi:hypothetical protein
MTRSYRNVKDEKKVMEESNISEMKEMGHDVV